MTSAVTILAILIALVPSSATNIAQPKVEPDKLNVVSSRLEGDWRLMPDLSKRLAERQTGRPIVSFQSDSSVVEKMPKKLADKLKALKADRIYLAGKLSFGKAENHRFYLVSLNGNPTIVYLRPKGEDPEGDVESLLIFLIMAANDANDILVIGPDSIRFPRPFSAYERKNRDNSNARWP